MSGEFFKSTDGGTSWKKLGGDLPAQTGRIGLANQRRPIRESSWAVGAKFTKEDLAGWMICAAKRAAFFDPKTEEKNGRARARWIRAPFYFSQIRIDPAKRSARLCSWGFRPCSCLDDGGKNFREDLSEKVSPGLSRAFAIQPGTVPPPKATQTGKTKTSPPKPQSLPTFAARDGWRRITRVLLAARNLGSSEQDSRRRILSNFARRHETVFPNCGRSPGQRELGGTERSAE